MESLDLLNQTLYKIYEQSGQHFKSAVFIAQIIGGITALLYSIKIAWSIYFLKEHLIISQIIKVFAVAMALIFYPQIISAFTIVIESSSEALANISIEKNDENPALSEILSGSIQQDQNVTRQRPSQNEGALDNESLNNQILEIIGKHTPQNTNDFLNEIDHHDNSLMSDDNTFNHQLLTISQIISQGIVISLFAIRTLILSVLFIVGPISIVLSLLPILNGSLIAWIQKFVSVSFWLPIAFIFNMLLIQVYQMVFEVGDFRDMTKILLFRMLTITAHLTIPSLSNWLFTKMIYKKQ